MKKELRKKSGFENGPSLKWYRDPDGSFHSNISTRQDQFLNLTRAKKNSNLSG